MGWLDSERRSSLKSTRLAALGLCRNIWMRELNAFDESRKLQEQQKQQNAEHKAFAHAQEIWQSLRVSYDFMVRMEETGYPQTEMNQPNNPIILIHSDENADEFILHQSLCFED